MAPYWSISSATQLWTATICEASGLRMLRAQDKRAVLHDYERAEALHTLGDVFCLTILKAPEILEGSLLRSKEGDVYALGMEAVTGAVPFSDRTDRAVYIAAAMQRQIPKRPKRFPSFTPDEAAQLWGLVVESCAYSPSDRPDSITIRDYEDETYESDEYEDNEGDGGKFVQPNSNTTPRTDSHANAHENGAAIPRIAPDHGGAGSQSQQHSAFKVTLDESGLLPPPPLPGGAADHARSASGSNGSARSRTTPSPVMGPPHRVVDEDYDDGGAADTLIGLSSYQGPSPRDKTPSSKYDPNVPVGSKRSREDAFPPPPSTDLRSSLNDESPREPALPPIAKLPPAPDSPRAPSGKGGARDAAKEDRRSASD
ncbi:hypothetical protein FRC09_014082 [Ceratobasidium sp. 395]|nr:hypothetical protein FRC09_014082 [Ceratobasidium sp. 395]